MSPEDTVLPAPLEFVPLWFQVPWPLVSVHLFPQPRLCLVFYFSRVSFFPFLCPGISEHDADLM